MSRERSSREPLTPRDVLIPLGVGLVLGVVTFIIRDGFSAEDDKALWHAICDALAVPGLLLTCTGLLSVSSKEGAFDGLSFTTRKAFSQILREEKRNAMPKTFYDYVTARREKQSGKRNIKLYVGIGFLLLAVAALAVWSSVG